MASLTSTNSGTLLQCLMNAVTKGRADHSNAAFSFRAYVADSAYPNEVTLLDGVSNTIDLGCISFTVASSSEASVATEAARIASVIRDTFGGLSKVSIADFISSQVWTITG